MSSFAPDRRLLTVRETAQRLAVSEKTVRRLVEAEILPALRISSRTVRIDPDELHRWLYQDEEATGGVPDPPSVALTGRRDPDSFVGSASGSRPPAGQEGR